jgi:hypothetical protein
MQLITSTNCHPQTDGQNEIINKWVEGYLINYVAGQQRVWVKWLHLGEYYYNTTHHLSIDMYPFKDLYGCDSLNFMEISFGDSRAPMDKE